ncbi:MAG: M3 family metallopeptidase, partial [Shewanella sp.]
QHSNTQAYPDLGAEFTASFGQDWRQTQDYPYSFNAIANDGPLYYQSLWQASLAQLIAQSTLNYQDKHTLFNLLVVNEDSLSLGEQLKAIIGAPVDSAALIQRISSMSGTDQAGSTNGKDKI